MAAHAPTFGDDQRPASIIRCDGEAAYFAGDLAYYLDKRERGFDRVVIMLGADHHGYIGRLMAMCAAFGDDPGVNLEILIGQLVNLVKDGQPVRMSKRAGTVVTMEDLVEAVGVDAARYALARSSADSHDRHRPRPADPRRRTTTPSSTCSTRTRALLASLRNAADARRRGATDDVRARAARRTTARRVLLGALGEFPRVVAQAAELREPHRVARYLEELAGHLPPLVRRAAASLPRGDEPVTDAHRARLWLDEATRQVLANGLGLLGVSAPERM